MTTAELKSALEVLRIRQHQLAELLGVTTRAVGMWVNGERAIPGAVGAYLSLLLSLPASLRLKELSRLNKESEMFDGMYRVDYAGSTGLGVAMLVFKDGLIFGSDGRVSYDGTYEPTGAPGELAITVRLTVPPGTPLVQGVVSGHQGFMFDVGPQRVNLKRPDATFSVVTPVNPPANVVTARISRLRDVPN